MLVAGAVALLLGAGALALVVTNEPGVAAGTDDGVLGPGPATVRLVIRHSRFSLSEIRVRPHTDVRFVVVNHDPIAHELIVGDDEVHARHELGTEPAHAPRPGEVSVAPGARGTTTFAVHTAGRVEYACHLPGHLAYGMKGHLVVDGGDPNENSRA